MTDIVIVDIPDLGRVRWRVPVLVVGRVYQFGFQRPVSLRVSDFS